MASSVPGNDRQYSLSSSMFIVLDDLAFGQGLKSRLLFQLAKIQNIGQIANCFNEFCLMSLVITPIIISFCWFYKFVCIEPIKKVVTYMKGIWGYNIWVMAR